MMINFSIGIFLATLIVSILSTRLLKLIFWYGVNSFFLGLLAIFIGFKQGDSVLIFSGVITLIFKAFTIPYYLKKFAIKFNLKRDVESDVKVHFNVMLIPVLIVFSFYLVSPFAHTVGQNSNYVAISISSLFLSLLLLIEHISVAPKIVGFLLMENSLFLLGITATGGMPMLIELGVFFDLMMAIVVINLLLKEERAI